MILDTLRTLIVDHQAILGLVILVGMFVAFVMERYPPTVVAVAGAAVMLSLGMLAPKEAFGVFSNSAPLTVAAMFVLSGALMRTGMIDKAADLIVRRAQNAPRRAVLELFGGALIAACFINNTPVVVLLIPICFRLADQLNISPKKLLIPASVIAVLGGCMTLVGTSTNLVVDGIAQEAGLRPFGLFEITPYGAVLVAAGVVGLLCLSWLLPSDMPAISEKGGEPGQIYLTEVTVRDTDDRLGKPYTAFGLPGSGFDLIAVYRGSRRLTGKEALAEEAAAGDRIIARMDGATLMTVQESRRFQLGIDRRDGEGSDKTQVIEATIAPNHPGIGARVRELPFFNKVKLRLLGLARVRHLPGPSLGEVRVHAADRLLIEADEQALRQLEDNPYLVGIAKSATRAFRPRKAWIAICAMVGTILVSAFGIMPIGIAAFIAVGLILVTRCIDASEAWGTIDGDVLVMIFAMLAVGLALEQAGSVRLMVDAITPWLASAPSWAVIVVIYFSALLLSELLSNNAVGALMAPIIIALAPQIGQDPRPLLIALMFGASACFATPIGYQTNMMVYAAGDYRFMDFVKIGVPLNIITGVSACLALSFMY
jgi:di/tricarboxylate transporter